MKLIVGLGNPGRSYARHRHNVGFMVVDVLAKRHGVGVKKALHDAKTGRGRVAGADAMLAKPQLYMNRSGYSVGPLFEYFKCDPDDLIVVHDDIDLAFGQIKVVHAAGHGGHNGVRSIVDEIGHTSFFRVRVGVGRPEPPLDPADYVLQKFADDEKEKAAQMVERAADAVEDLLKLPLKEVQQRYH